MAKNLLDVWPKLGRCEKEWIAFIVENGDCTATSDTHQFVDRKRILEGLNNFTHKYGPVVDGYWDKGYATLWKLLK